MKANTANFGAGRDKTPAENRQAMLAAIRAVELAGGGEVFLTPGVYEGIGDELPPDVRLIGERP